MKNKRLNLNELKVKSFVTLLEADKADMANGGGSLTAQLYCPSIQTALICESFCIPCDEQPVYD
ncbi:MAG: pinensin family lanthipeptide [Cyclobacteriaceae bacterium]